MSSILVLMFTQENFTPLMYISDMDHMEPMARALLKHGASMDIDKSVSI